MEKDRNISNQILLTFDVDWAPDAAIEITAEILRKYRVKSTWFLTHMSPALAALKEEPDLFEIGIHPNFLSGSSHGETDEEVLSYMTQIAPQASCIRTHAMVNSGPLLEKITSLTSVSIDSSIFLPEHPYIQPIKQFTSNRTLLRYPVFWADAYEFQKEQKDWNPQRYFEIPGCKVLAFHPIHIAINSPTIDIYNKVKDQHPDLSKMSSVDLMKFDFKNAGTRTFLEDTVRWLTESGEGLFFQDISEI